MPDHPSVVDTDLPALYQAADKASLAGQRVYLRLIRADLLLLVSGAVLGSFALDSVDTQRWIAVAAVVVLVLGLLATILLRTVGTDRFWYEGRAVAESVKTISWRYMTRAEPYGPNVSSIEADKVLANALGQILKECHEIASEIGGDLAAMPQISSTMRRVRDLPLDERKKTYLDCRIEDQRTWYSKKAELNRKARSQWLYAIMIAQTLGAVYAVYLVISPGSQVNLVGAFAAAGAALWGWLQLKQHHELSQSYAIAAHELGLIAVRLSGITDDGGLSSFVADAESAISREHTLWLARRDHMAAV